MSYDDNRPIQITSDGWEKLPDGRQQLRIWCKTLLDYELLPPSLKMGALTLSKVGWDSDKGVAFYRPGIEDLEGEVTE
jgi:hypothetical protein